MVVCWKEHRKTKTQNAVFEGYILYLRLTNVSSIHYPKLFALYTLLETFEVVKAEVCFAIGLVG